MAKDRGKKSAKEKDAQHQVTKAAEAVREAYQSKDKEVKRSARSDKRSYIEELADKAEQAAARGEMSIVYKIT